MSSRGARRGIVGAVVAALLGVGLIAAPPASAAITAFSTLMAGTNGRASYTYVTPYPASGVYLKFVLNAQAAQFAAGTEWVFLTSTDTQAATSGTINYDPTSMVNSSCTFCIIAKDAGPTTYLPNGTYTTSMYFLDTTGGTTTSATSSLTSNRFIMPATMTPASNTTAGANLLTISATAPVSVKSGDSTAPYANASRFVLAGTGACTGDEYTVILANPAANVAATVTIDYASPAPTVTSTVTMRSASGDALVRGCSYDVSFLYQGLLNLAPLPSNATNTPFVTTTVTNILIPTAPAAPTNVQATATGSTTATVTWTLGADGGLPLGELRVIVTPGNMAFVTANNATSANITALADGTTYTFAVRATNAVGATTSATATATTNHCLDAAAAGVDWSGCTKTNSTLTGIDLTGADFTSTNLSGSNLTNANLTSANLTGANLTGATLTGVTSGSTVGDSATVLPTNWVLASGVLTTLPGAPPIAVAAAGDGYVAVAWTAPTFTGYGTITGYTVTASPGSQTCSATTAMTCQVTGLSNGTAYTFTVTASTAAGAGAGTTVTATPAASSGGSGGGGSSGGGSSGSSGSSTSQSTSRPVGTTTSGTPSTSPPATTPATGGASTVMLQTASVTFATGSAALPAALRRALNKQLAAVPRGAATSATVTATVRTRDSAADQRLALQRAERVRRYLRTLGVYGPIDVQLKRDDAQSSRRVLVALATTTAA